MRLVRLTSDLVSNMSNRQSATLLMSCPDKKGLVAAIANFLMTYNANILHADQHQDGAARMPGGMKPVTQGGDQQQAQSMQQLIQDSRLPGRQGGLLRVVPVAERAGSDGNHARTHDLQLRVWQRRADAAVSL